MFEISEIKYFLFKIYHKNMYCQNICDFREKKREKGKEKKISFSSIFKIS